MDSAVDFQSVVQGHILAHHIPAVSRVLFGKGCGGAGDGFANDRSVDHFHFPRRLIVSHVLDFRRAAVAYGVGEIVGNRLCIFRKITPTAAELVIVLILVDSNDSNVLMRTGLDFGGWACGIAAVVFRRPGCVGYFLKGLYAVAGGNLPFHSCAQGGVNGEGRAVTGAQRCDGAAVDGDRAAGDGDRAVVDGVCAAADACRYLVLGIISNKAASGGDIRIAADGDIAAIAIIAAADACCITAAAGFNGAAADLNVAAGGHLYIISIAAADACCLKSAVGCNRAAGNFDGAAIAETAAADACAIEAASGGDLRIAADRDFDVADAFAGARVAAAADACAVLAAGGCNIAAGNGNLYANALIAAADACAIVAAGGFNIAAGNGDFAATAATAAADACASIIAGGCNGAAGNIDGAGVGLIISISSAAADACASTIAGGCNGAAGDGDIAAIAFIAAADACRIIAAGGCNLAAMDGDVAACAF